MIELANQKNKKIGIFGLARTGSAAYRTLLGKAEKVICWDDQEPNRKHFAADFGKKPLLNIDDQAWTQLDEIVLSPGVPLKFPKPHPIVELAKANNIKIISDLDLFYESRKDSFIISITGTNGKSTTVALTHFILGEAWDFGGNIGKAALSMDQDSNGYVIEMSSYQIDLIQEYKSRIAILLNITPDHLDRHGSFEEYTQTKASLLELAEISIIGIDNDITNDIYEKNKDRLRLIPISTKKILDYGISVVDGVIYDHITEKKNFILPPNKHLAGRHNNENIAASFMAAKLFGMKGEAIVHLIADFKGLPHRLQYLGNKEGIDFYNDSKATNMDSVRGAVQSLSNIHLIAGGRSKAEKIDSIFDLKDRITRAYFYGESRNEFANLSDSVIKYDIFDTMSEAFEAAYLNAKKSGNHPVILLSPGCSSFDQFKNFEERGCFFIKLYDKI